MAKLRRVYISFNLYLRRYIYNKSFTFCNKLIQIKYRVTVFVYTYISSHICIYIIYFINATYIYVCMYV